MNWLDTAILAVLALAGLLGARTGLVGQVARLAALVAGLYGAIRFNDRVTPLLAEAVVDAPPWLAQALAYAVVFLAIYAVLLTVTILLERGVKVARMQWMNRILGSALGAAKAGLLLGLLFLALHTYLPEFYPDTLKGSTLVPYLSASARKVVDAIPEEYRDNLRAQLRQLEGLPQAVQQKEPSAQ
jgi:membrane protein required for colicin V production